MKKRIIRLGLLVFAIILIVAIIILVSNNISSRKIKTSIILPEQELTYKIEDEDVIKIIKEEQETADDQVEFIYTIKSVKPGESYIYYYGADRTKPLVIEKYIVDKHKKVTKLEEQ